MTLEQAEQLWRSAQVAGPPPAQAVKEIRQAARRFRVAIVWRDIRELLATLLVVGVFLHIAAQDGAPQGPLLIAAGLASVPMVFIGIHRWLKYEPRNPGASAREHIERAYRDVQAQQWLLQNVVWWYLLPLGASVAVFLVGSIFAVPNNNALLGSIALLLGALVCVPLGVFIERLNRRVAQDTLRPRAEYLASLIAQLDEQLFE